MVYKCRIAWIKGRRKRSIPTNFKYSCTTYVKGINHMLSVIIEINEDINEGLLSFLRKDLVKDLNFNINSWQFSLYEGENIVGIATITN